MESTVSASLTMENAINTSIQLLAEKINNNVKGDEALKFTQAALNLAHVLQVKKQTSVTR